MRHKTRRRNPKNAGSVCHERLGFDHVCLFVVLRMRASSFADLVVSSVEARVAMKMYT